MKKKFLTVISLILLISVLTISLVACERDYEDVEYGLKNKGYDVTLTEKEISDSQLDFLSQDKLKWSIKATRNTEDYKDIKDVDVLFVLQYSRDTAAETVIDQITNTDNKFKYNLNNDLLTFTYKRVGGYIYYGTPRAVRSVSTVSLYDMEIREDNLFYYGYETKAQRENELFNFKVDFIDSQLPFINGDDLHYMIKGVKQTKDGYEFVYILKYNDEEKAKEVYGLEDKTKIYNFEGQQLKFTYKLVDGILYVGTETGVHEAYYML